MNATIDVKHLLPVWEQFRAAPDIAAVADLVTSGAVEAAVAPLALPSLTETVG